MKQLSKLRKKAKKETKRIVLLTNLRDLILKLLEIMKNHISMDNAISKNNLFNKVYGLKIEQVSEMQEWYMWELIKKALHRMRQRTKCFVVSEQRKHSRFSTTGGTYFFFVAKDISDFNIYRDNINRNIRAMRNMVNKCNRSIDKEWWKEDWTYK